MNEDPGDEVIARIYDEGTIVIRTFPKQRFATIDLHANLLLDPVELDNLLHLQKETLGIEEIQRIGLARGIRNQEESEA